MSITCYIQNVQSRINQLTFNGTVAKPAPAWLDHNSEQSGIVRMVIGTVINFVAGNGISQLRKYFVHFALHYIRLNERRNCICVSGRIIIQTATTINVLPSYLEDQHQLRTLFAECDIIT